MEKKQQVIQCNGHGCNFLIKKEKIKTDAFFSENHVHSPLEQKRSVLVDFLPQDLTADLDV